MAHNLRCRLTAERGRSPGIVLKYTASHAEADRLDESENHDNSSVRGWQFSYIIKPECVQ